MPLNTLYLVSIFCSLPLRSDQIHILIYYLVLKPINEKIRYRAKERERRDRE
jgi:hypothetical protein